MTGPSKPRRLSAFLIGTLALAISHNAAMTSAQSNRADFSEDVARLLLGMDEEIIKKLKLAWVKAGAGSRNSEGAVLVYRMRDGSYRGELQRQTNEYVKLSFKWSVAAKAIIHTHPTKFDPTPSESDILLANRFGVPVFTITMSGMYVYDPVTRATSKVQDNLDWLDISKWKSNRAWISKR